MMCEYVSFYDRKYQQLFLIQISIHSSKVCSSAIENHGGMLLHVTATRTITKELMTSLHFVIIYFPCINFVYFDEIDMYFELAV